ncbi:MAG: GGDEF domain-containing protein [Burkholderiales bacterium]|nr:GGDEF domain-containing protein [Burkholderiales bacterium]
MPVVRNMFQEQSDWVASGRFLDLLSARRHAPYLKRHRLAAIDARAKVVAIAFAIAILLWIALDVITLSANLWRFLLAARLFAILVLLRLSIEPDRDSSRLRALTVLGVVLAMPLMIYGVSQYVFAGLSHHGAAAVNANLYRALPLLVLAGLSMFPLVASEAILLGLMAGAVVGSIQWALGGVNSIELLSGVWIFVLVMGVYLVGCAIQLNHMMILAHRASHDPLSGALTRASGVEVLDLHFRLSCAQDAPLSVLLLGVEDFKPTDPISGRTARDLALKTVVGKLHALLRQADVVIRWDNEQFVVILANTPVRGARLVVERIIRELLAARTELVPFAPYMGLAERQTDNAEDWWLLIALSAKRMQQARQTGVASCADQEGLIKPGRAGA